MSSDPIEKASSGAMQGLLTWSKQEIKNIAQAFRQRKLTFIEDQQAIEQAIQERKSPEWQLYSQYVKSPDLRILLQVGLTLRKLEGKPSLQNLRDRIKQKYGARGLHIAEFVQNEIIGVYISLMLRRARTTGDMTNEIEKLLREIDKYVIFVKIGDSVSQRVKELNIRLAANVPDALILLGSGSAKITVNQIAAKLSKQAADYEVMRFDEKSKTIIIFHRNLW